MVGLSAFTSLKNFTYFSLLKSSYGFQKFIKCVQNVACVLQKVSCVLQKKVHNLL